ncbi:MAG: hypothetical protein QXX45_00915 [Candidatus Aenigmatarchaeota archaeon]
MISIAWDLVFYFVLVFLGVLGFIVIATGIFPNLLIFNKEAVCRSRLSNYCSLIVCDHSVGFDLTGCEEYTGTNKPTKEDCIRFGFKCR